MIVICPSYYELELKTALNSLLNCVPLNGIVEVFPILNYSDTSDPEIINFHQEQFEYIKKLEKATSNQKIKVLALPPFSLPEKFAGVGLARKIGMDEAVRRFEDLGVNGIIVNYDADCLCSPLYLQQIEKSFGMQAKMDAVSIGFKHHLHNLNPALKLAIQTYELHLRSYIGWQKYFKYPFAFQTLGSCFAVKSIAYQAQGGMNKRKAGEDFYFLHKFSVLETLGELNQPLVFPSGRISTRVPFGTGKAVQEIIELPDKYLSYNSKAIGCFCNFFNVIISKYSDLRFAVPWKSWVLSDSLSAFLEQQNFESELHDCLKHCASEATFNKRISRWLNPFRLMKYLHFAQDNEFENIEVLESVRNLLKANLPNCDFETLTIEELFEYMNDFDYKCKVLA
ncbi:MAG: glycosyltransferase family 2 protein [Saprospiraceae bacterium]|nr:glycosyltransferase family 2 protein [Saprospiraceae bacterium]